MPKRQRGATPRRRRVRSGVLRDIGADESPLAPPEVDTLDADDKDPAPDEVDDAPPPEAAEPGAVPAPPPPTTQNGRIQRATELLRDLATDINTIQRSGEAYRQQTQPASVQRQRRVMDQLYTEFTQRAAAAVRRTQIGTITMEELMEKINRTTATAPDPRGAEQLCERVCVYVSRATAQRCLAAPWMIVSLTQVDMSEPNNPYVYTLCFDADELEGQIKAFRDSKEKAMPNPAHKDPRTRRSGMATTLSAQDVEVLEWQVRLSRERRALQKAEITAEDRGILIGMVLPALADYIMRTRGGGMLVRMYNYTPAVLQRFFTAAGNSLLFLLESPVLSTIALLITRAMRTVICLSLFGLEEKEWDQLMTAMFDVAYLELHYPTIYLIYHCARTSLMCLQDVIALNAFSCSGRLASAVLKFVPVFGTIIVNVVTSIMEGIGGCFVYFGQGMNWMWGVMYSSQEWRGFSSLYGSLVNTVSFGYMVFDREETLARRLRNNLVSMSSEMHDIFRYFYSSMITDVGMGMALWLTRGIDAKMILAWLMRSFPLNTFTLMIQQTINTIIDVGQNANLHRVLCFILESARFRARLDTVWRPGGGAAAPAPAPGRS